MVTRSMFISARCKKQAEAFAKRLGWLLACITLTSAPLSAQISRKPNLVLNGAFTRAVHLMTAVEGINGYHSGIAFWEAQLNRGYRLTGIGGSDSHNADNLPPEPGAIGTPTTVVYASELSETAILDGIRSGHAFIDLEGSPDRMLTFNATAGPQTAGMGDVLQALSDRM